MGHIFTVQYADRSSSTFAVDVSLSSTVQRQVSGGYTATEVPAGTNTGTQVTTDTNNTPLRKLLHPG